MTHLAILIDADNISSKMMERIMLHTARYGTAIVRRIYGDWSQPQLASWKALVLEYAFLPMQQYRYAIGKNATDAALIIDAMDLLYGRDIDGFCLVSSDSDFTRLALRLREAGKTVIGLGCSQAPQAYRAACSAFIELDKCNGVESAKPLEKKPPEKKKSPGEGRGRKHKKHDLPEEEVFFPEFHEDCKLPGIESNDHEADSDNLPFFFSIDQTAEIKNEGADSEEFTSFQDEAEHILRAAVTKLANSEGWANLGELGAEIHKMKPRPKLKRLGRRKLIEQIRMFSCFEVILRKDTKVPLHFVRLVQSAN